MEHAGFDHGHRAVEHDADEGEQHDRIEHHRSVGLAFTEGDEIAKAGIAADELADGDADDRQRGADAQPRHQRRHRGRHLDLPEDLQPAHAVGTRQVDQVAVHRLHRLQHVHQDREEHHQDGHDQLGPGVVAEPHDEQRRKGNLGRDLQPENIGRQHLLDEHRHAEHVAHAGSEQAADHKAQGGDGHGREGVHHEVLALRHAHELMSEIGHRRNDVGRHAERRRQELPGEQEQHAERKAAGEDRRRRCEPARRRRFGMRGRGRKLCGAFGHGGHIRAHMASEIMPPSPRDGGSRADGRHIRAPAWRICVPWDYPGSADRPGSPPRCGPAARSSPGCDRT